MYDSPSLHSPVSASSSKPSSHTVHTSLVHSLQLGNFVLQRAEGGVGVGSGEGRGGEGREGIGEERGGGEGRGGII